MTLKGWVLRGEGLRTPSGPGGSSGKQPPSGDAGAPGLSLMVVSYCWKHNNRGCAAVSKDKAGRQCPLSLCPDVG